KLHYIYSDMQLRTLLLYDSDSFSRWQAAQQLAVNQLVPLIIAAQQNEPLIVDNDYLDLLAHLLQNRQLDHAFLALLLTLPNEQYLADFFRPSDPLAIHRAREYLSHAFATHCRSALFQEYTTHHDNVEYALTQAAIGRRALKNV